MPTNGPLKRQHSADASFGPFPERRIAPLEDYSAHVYENGPPFLFSEAFSYQLEKDLEDIIRDLRNGSKIPFRRPWPHHTTLSVEGRHKDRAFVTIRLPSGQEIYSEPALVTDCERMIRLYQNSGPCLRWELTLPMSGKIHLRMTHISFPAKDVQWKKKNIERIYHPLCGFWKIEPERFLLRLKEPLARVLPERSPRFVHGLPWRRVGYVSEVRAWRDAMGNACLSTLTSHTSSD